MARSDFSISGIFNSTFGINRGRPFDAEQAQQSAVRREQAFDNLPASQDDEGTEFINMRNTLSANNPVTGAPFFMPVSLGGITLPNEPTLLVIGKKNILETPLVGSTRRGTVKELISVEDYDITIRGIAINYASKLVYPEDTVKQLYELFERNESLEIESALTNLLGIYRVVIRQVTFPEMVGFQHAQAYEFQCVSEEDFILEID